MGNHVFKCCVGVTTVQVMRANGRMEEFEFPVLASEVMRRFPNHLVIHSNFLDRDSFFEQSRKVNMVRPECALVPGQIYFLYPIPPAYREVVSRSIADQSSSREVVSSSSLNAENQSNGLKEEQPRKKISRRSQLLAATRQHVNTILQSTRESKAGEQGCDSGASARQPLMERNRADDDEEFSFFCSATWRPSLYSIPESPRVPDRLECHRHSFSSNR